MKKIITKIIPAGVITLASSIKAHAQISYNTAQSQASSSGVKQFIDTWGNTFLYLMLFGGIVGLAWVGVELLFFDKEIRDVKKGLIGAVIMVIAPAIVIAAKNANS